MPSMRVLVAEDEATVSELILRVLRRAGYQVTGVSSCAEALAFLGDADADIVLFDLHLRDGDGFQIVEAMEAGKVHPARLVLMTGDPIEDDDPRASRVGVILHKPFGLEDLESAVVRASA